MVVCRVASVLTLLLGLLAWPADVTAGTPSAVRRGKWIEIVLSEQRLIAWEGQRIVMSTAVSTGKRATPTPRGAFRIYRKHLRQRMRGPGYDLPRVPYVMYFRAGGYALHGTYWHNAFGRPMSRGCVNLPTRTARWLYHWAPLGTPVIVR